MSHGITRSKRTQKLQTRLVGIVPKPKYKDLDEIAEAAYLRGLAKFGPAPKKPWIEQAREEQLPADPNYTYWALIGGRGSGKTRSGAEETLRQVRNGRKHLAVLAPTYADVRDVCIEGESGILACALPGEVRDYNRSMGEVYFSTGAKLKMFAAIEPDRLNGPQHDFIWGDEFGLWKPGIAAMDMALFGLRLGENPQLCLTSTPKPTKITKYVLGLSRLVVTRMKMRNNIANLAPGVVEELERRYAGTRLGKQELDGELLEDIEGALWTAQMIQDAYLPNPNPIIQYVVAVDPSVSDPEKRTNPHKEQDACGIICAGLRSDGTVHVTHDLSGVFSPSQWAKVCVGAYNNLRASKIIGEKNQGGELVRLTLQTVGPMANIQLVHASMGKRARAEPVAALYEQGRITHERGLEALEAELTSWDATDPSQPSPNRLDALVWAIHGLGLCDATGTRMTSRVHRLPQR